ncbi:hypothetical protein SLE2022_312770 [Rubroshorea leprosula]
MESKAVFWVNSLPVPCVQELAKEPLTTIPPRYIRPERQQQPIVSDDGLVREIPIIDMQSLLSEESMEAELTKLDFACREWGFFQLVNHGVSSSTLENVKKGAQGLFNLPMEEKKKYWQYSGEMGEMEGFSKAFVFSEEQELDWGDLFFIVTQPPHLRKPHLFPKLPLPFREALELYSLELKNLAMAILRKLAKGLHMETSEMEEIFEEDSQFIRINYYPPCPQPDMAIGLSPHSDGSALTILLHVNEVEGLQVKKDGKWVPVKPLQNAFIVNVGDSLEIVTNGAYRSIEHRVTVNSAMERLTIGTFYNSKYDGEIGPARSLISQEKPALFRRITYEEYRRVKLGGKLNGKSHLDTFRL